MGNDGADEYLCVFYYAVRQQDRDHLWRQAREEESEEPGGLSAR